jgi:hypothetical protein
VRALISLRSCWAKLGRAQSHRESLDDSIRQHFSDPANIPTLTAELDIAENCHVFRVASIPSTIIALQETTAIVIGDAVHNLRSVLDHLVFQLALLSTNGQIKNPRSLQFPIAETPMIYSEQERSHLSELRQEHKAIIETYQPYHGISRPSSPPYIYELALLKQLSNTDKHRLLNTVLTIVQGATYRFPPGIDLAPLGPEPIPYPFRSRAESLEVGAEVSRDVLIGNVIPATFPDAGYIVPLIAFEENRPVIATVRGLERFVEIILKDFEKRLACEQ